LFARPEASGIVWQREEMKICALGLLGNSFLVAAACTHPIPGPVPPDSVQVREVRVEALPPRPGIQRSISDPDTLGSIARSYAISSRGWVSSRGRELEPLYRIEILEHEGSRTAYWLGANSHPPRFPCYALCSGWWVAPSTEVGTIDASRYKDLPDSVSPDFLTDLGIP
jgi:hypothetical protein